MASARVKIGDTIEFAARNGRSDGTGTTAAALTAARVMDVNPDAPSYCSVQISPYEPLQTIDLHECVYKVRESLLSILEHPQSTTLPERD